MNRKPDGYNNQQRPASNAQWHLRLYVNGRWSLKTLAALENIEELCETYLTGRYELEVVDLIEDFAKAEQDHVIALPTLVRLSPLPLRKVIGDLSNRDQVIVALGLPGASANLL
jgi:circadian clock protein KaiB